jgi:hypothetical protein
MLFWQKFLCLSLVAFALFEPMGLTANGTRDLKLVCRSVYRQMGIAWGSPLTALQRENIDLLLPQMRQLAAERTAFLQARAAEGINSLDRLLMWEEYLLNQVEEAWSQVHGADSYSLQVKEELEQNLLPETVSLSTDTETEVLIHRDVPKQMRRMPPDHKKRLEEFIEQLKVDPFSEWIKSRPRFQTSHHGIQSKNNFQPIENGRWTHYHAHLKSGQPTLVVSWWFNTTTGAVEVDFFGPHEEANQHLDQLRRR